VIVYQCKRSPLRKKEMGRGGRKKNGCRDMTPQGRKGWRPTRNYDGKGGGGVQNEGSNRSVLKSGWGGESGNLKPPRRPVRIQEEVFFYS